MKTYEEMAQSVIDRAKAHKTLRNRWIAGSVAAVLALCVCVGVMGRRPQPDTTMQEQPVTQTAKTEPRVTFLYAQGDTTSELKQGVKLPSHCELRVVDVSGMTDEEIEAIALEEQEYADALTAAYPDDKGHGWMQYSADGYPSASNDHLVATFINAGYFILDVQDWSSVESVEATTKNSVLILPAFSGAEEKEQIDPFAYPQSRHYHMNRGELNEAYEAGQWYYDGIGVNIGLGSGVVWYLNDNPVPLSQLSETITFTFNFTDGTQETYTIDMIFNDNGQIYTLYRGAEAAV